jgi:hypothetical protein
MTVQSADSASSGDVQRSESQAIVRASDAGVPCRRCGADLAQAPTWERLRICPFCRYHGQLSARQRLEILLDEGTFRESHQTLTSVDPLGFSDRVPYSERLAGAWELPVVTLIDTPGAALDFDSEARGLAPSIAQCLATMPVLPVPIVAAVIGEGGSGGALALGVADRILMLENAIYSVIAPEGAAAILYHDAQRARDLADALKLTAADCKLLGVVDTLVPEPEGGAHLDRDYAALLLKNFVLDALLDLRKVRTSKLLDARYRKFRRMGQQPTTSRRAAVAHEMDDLQRRLSAAWTQVWDHLPHREGTGRATPERDAPAEGVVAEGET